MPDRIGPLRDVCRCGRGRGFGAATCLARPEQHLPVAVVQLLLVVGEALRAKDAEERHRLERCEKPQALSGAQSGNCIHELVETLPTGTQAWAHVEAFAFRPHKNILLSYRFAVREKDKDEEAVT